MAATAPALGEKGERLYKFSTWVHIGPGSEDCEGIDEEAGTNDCGNALHFHAWCRLPNPLVHREIREHGLAAKARRARQLRDPDSDAHAILEDDLDRLARSGDKEEVVTELLKADMWRDHMEAVADVMEIEAPDQPADSEGEGPVLLYAHIEADQDRYVELGEKKADLPPDADFDEQDELDRLDAHLRGYNDEVEKRRVELEEPRRRVLEEKDISELVDMLRDQRIDVDSNGHFVHTYSLFQWLACTLRDAKKQVRVWSEKKQMEDAAPEVIFAVQEAFQDLEASQQEALRGNS